MKHLLLLAAILTLPTFSATTKFYEADVAVGASAKVLAVDSRRNYLFIQNKGSESIFFKCDSAHSALEGIEIAAGGYYEPFEAPICDVYLKAESGTQTVHILSGRY